MICFMSVYLACCSSLMHCPIVITYEISIPPDSTDAQPVNRRRAHHRFCCVGVFRSLIQAWQRHHTLDSPASPSYFGFESQVSFCRTVLDWRDRVLLENGLCHTSHLKRQQPQMWLFNFINKLAGLMCFLFGLLMLVTLPVPLDWSDPSPWPGLVLSTVIGFVFLCIGWLKMRERGVASLSNQLSTVDAHTASQDSNRNDAANNAKQR